MSESDVSQVEEEALEEPRQVAQEPPTPGLPVLRWELVAYGALLALAVVTRLWDLGSQAINHDESLHAFYSWGLYTGGGYDHNPLMHGPFQFHGTALMFFLFGDSDYTARLLPALFGIALVGLPFFLRHHLGRAGALITSLFLVFSPAMLYYSRFARNDIYMAVWALALVTCMWRYLHTGRPRYLYLTALFLALAFATKETTYILAPILGAYLFILAAVDVVPWLLGRKRLSQFSRAGGLFVLLVTLSIPQWAAGISLFQDSLGITLAGREGIVGAPAGDGVAVAAIAIAVLLAISGTAGVFWNARVWATCAGIFYSVWVLLYTTFFTNIMGIGSGLWQSLGYWVVQQDVARGGQPWYYYFVLFSIYEMVALVFAVIAAIYYLRKGPLYSASLALGALFIFVLDVTVRGGFTFLSAYLGIPLLLAAITVAIFFQPEKDLFPGFLVFWAALTLALYSFAGEKMPWLLVNITLPLIVLSGKFLGELVEEIPWRRVVERGGMYLLLWLPLTLYFAARLAFTDPTRTSAPAAAFWVVALILVSLVTAGGYLVSRPNPARRLGLLALGVAAALTIVFIGSQAIRDLNRWEGSDTTFMAMVFVLIFLVGVATYLISRAGLAHGLAMVALGLAGILFIFGMRTAIATAYFNGDVAAKEMLLYAQGSPDVPRIARDIEELAQVSGKGDELRIVVDTSESWPWYWYLRHYKNVSYRCYSEERCSPPAEVPEGDILLIGGQANGAIQGRLQGFSRGERHIRIWWFPEVYKNVTLSMVWDGIRSRNQWKKITDFLLYRKIDSAPYTSEAYYYYSLDLPRTPAGSR